MRQQDSSRFADYYPPPGVDVSVQRVKGRAWMGGERPRRTQDHRTNEGEGQEQRHLVLPPIKLGRDSSRLLLSLRESHTACAPHH